MNRFRMPYVSAAITLALASLSTTAAAQTWSATMNGANEAPPNASAGTGFALLSLAGNTLTIVGSFSGLTGTTTAAHLHCCTATALTGTAGVATTTPSFVGFPLSVTGGSIDLVLDLT
uniref:CHRD domain-containing protein n=1 Tax=Gemmatimonas sp. TaxID=1962908 RepID=UPI0039838820